MAASKKPKPGPKPVKSSASGDRRRKAPAGKSDPEEDLEIVRVLKDAGKRTPKKKAAPARAPSGKSAKKKAAGSAGKVSSRPDKPRPAAKGAEWRSLRNRGRVMALFLFACLAGAAGYGWWRLQEMDRKLAVLARAEPESAPEKKPESPPEKKPESPPAPEDPAEADIDAIVAELGRLKERNKLSKFADEAISTGSRYAMKELERRFEDPALPGLKDAANAEIMRVEAHYLSTRKFRRYEIPMARLFPGKQSEAQLGIEELADLLMTETNSWEVRARAAQLMGEIRNDARVPAVLVRALQTDPDLYVVQEALSSFGKTTGYRAAGVFDASVAERWWQENKERFNVRKNPRTESP